MKTTADHTIPNGTGSQNAEHIMSANGLNSLPVDSRVVTWGFGAEAVCAVVVSQQRYSDSTYMVKSDAGAYCRIHPDQIERIIEIPSAGPLIRDIEGKHTYSTPHRVMTNWRGAFIELGFHVESYKKMLERVEIQLSDRSDNVIQKLVREIHEVLNSKTEYEEAMAIARATSTGASK